MLKKALEAKGVTCFLCDVPEGEGIAKVVTKAICEAELIVFMGTKTFAKETNSSFGTSQVFMHIIIYNVCACVCVCVYVG